jgi:hypothetical protein
LRTPDLLLACAACVIFLGVSAACSGTETGSRGRGAFANQTEIAWMKKFGNVHGTIGNCLAEVQAQAGPPPTPRLRPAYRLFERACRAARQGRATQAMFDASWNSATLGIRQRLPNASGSFVYARAGEAASYAAGQQTEVRCWSKNDWARLLTEYLAVTGGLRGRAPDQEVGFYGGGHAIQLAARICTTLDEMSHTAHPDQADADLLFDWSQALITVAHEAVHSTGVSSESTAECWAIQLVPESAATFGMDRALGVALAHNAWATYPTEPRIYHTPACRKGGRLDLKQRLTVWN